MVPNLNNDDTHNDHNSNRNFENPRASPETTKIMSDAPASSSDSPPSNLKQDKGFSKATNPLAAAKRSSDPKTFSKMPSWREIGTPSEPFFNVAILIDDINVMDSHASAMSKPASRCYLTNVVVLNSTSDDPKQVQESVKEWLRMNKIDVDVEDLDIGQGLVGYTEMLKQLEIDAVYIVLSPRSVSG